MSIAYQYNASGFYVGAVEDYGILPNNATYKKPPVIQKGKWPQWTGKAWKQAEDHREREDKPELVEQFGEGFVQEATEFWLSGDTYESPARTMKEAGPLPKGVLLERPMKPEPTVFEKIAEVQAPFIEQQNLAKSDFLTARLEGDAELEAEIQAEYQAIVEEMDKATQEVKDQAAQNQ